MMTLQVWKFNCLISLVVILFCAKLVNRLRLVLSCSRQTIENDRIKILKFIAITWQFYKLISKFNILNNSTNCQIFHIVNEWKYF